MGSSNGKCYIRVILYTPYFSLHRSQYNRITSSSSLPYMQTFDLINCRLSVISSCPYHPATSTSTPNHVPLSSNDSTLTAMILSILQILSSFASIAQTRSSYELAPTTPIHSWINTQDPTASTVLSLVINTPSKLSRFLKYAKSHLEIPNAWLYEQCLEESGYGPDILHLIIDGDLLTETSSLPCFDLAACGSVSMSTRHVFARIRSSCVVL